MKIIEHNILYYFIIKILRYTVPYLTAMFSQPNSLFRR